jgi:site-specific DNA-methyltransferase (adenine-specific)
MAGEDYSYLARSACGLMRPSLAAPASRAWINVGVPRLHLWLDALDQSGLSEQSIVCWNYGIATSHTAWASWRSPGAPHLRYGREPVIHAHDGRSKRTPPAGMDTWRAHLSDWATLCRNTWRIPPGASTHRVHPAVMPVELARRAIPLATWPGETVLDIFAGSGTTLVAARQLGWRAIGVEITERYCELAVRRLDRGMLDLGGTA